MFFATRIQIANTSKISNDIYFSILVPDQFTSSHRKQYKDHSSAKRNFVRRIIDKALRKTPIQRDRSQVGKT